MQADKLVEYLKNKKHKEREKERKKTSERQRETHKARTKERKNKRKKKERTMERGKEKIITNWPMGPQYLRDKNLLYLISYPSQNF